MLQVGQHISSFFILLDTAYLLSNDCLYGCTKSGKITRAETDRFMQIEARLLGLHVWHAQRIGNSGLYVHSVNIITFSAVDPTAAAVAVPLGTEELASTKSTAILLPSGADLTLLILTVFSRYRWPAAHHS